MAPAAVKEPWKGASAALATQHQLLTTEPSNIHPLPRQRQCSRLDMPSLRVLPPLKSSTKQVKDPSSEVIKAQHRTQDGDDEVGSSRSEGICT